MYRYIFAPLSNSPCVHPMIQLIVSFKILIIEDKKVQPKQ